MCMAGTAPAGLTGSHGVLSCSLWLGLWVSQTKFGNTGS